MKKSKRPGRNLNAKRGAKRNNRHAKRDRLAETIRRMAAEGLVEDQIALRLGLDKNDLRAKFIDDIKQGKSAAAASEADAEELSQEDYHWLDSARIHLTRTGRTQSLVTCCSLERTARVDVLSKICSPPISSGVAVTTARAEAPGSTNKRKLHSPK